MATFDSNITINISLEAPPSIFTGFQSALFISSDSTLGGDRVKSYSSLAAVQADNTAGNVSATALAAATAAFSQSRRPQNFLIGRRDSGGGESFADAIAAIVAVNNNFYTVAIDDRGTIASLESASGAIETLTKLAVMGSNDASWLTATPDAGFDTMRARERTALVWHNSATEPVATAYASKILTHDPDTRSAPWTTPLTGLNNYTPALTDSQAANALSNNINLMQAYGPAPQYVDPGVNLQNRPLYELLTRDWFQIRLQERMSALVVDLSERGQKLVLDDNGGAASAQDYALSVVGGLYGEGLQALHFVDDPNASFDPVPITSTDINLQRLRITGRARFAASGRLFNFDLNFVRTAL